MTTAITDTRPSLNNDLSKRKRDRDARNIKAHLQQTYAPAPCVFINRGCAGCGLVPLCLPPFPARLNYTALTQPWIHGPVSLQPAPLGTDALQSPTRHIRGLIHDQFLTNGPSWRAHRWRSVRGGTGGEVSSNMKVLVDSNKPVIIVKKWPILKIYQLVCAKTMTNFHLEDISIQN